MAGILVAHARFVEVQQRRARIVVELNQSHETRAPRTRPDATDEPIEVGGRPTRDFDAKTTGGVVDAR
jgi:hypothetical protein